MIKTFAVVLSLVALGAATRLTAQTSDAEKTYRLLVERANRGDTTLDYTELRNAYTKTSGYNPGAESPEVTAMKKAIHGGNQREIAVTALRVLQKDFVHCHARLVCADAYLALGDTAKALYHGEILKKLLESIRKSGNGMKRETAFRIIAPEERAVLLYISKLSPLEGSEPKTSQVGDRYYQVQTYISSATGARTTLWFDITTIVNRNKELAAAQASDK